MNRKSTLLALVAISLGALAGCASAPRPTGAVVPLEGGRYQWNLRGSDEGGAMKTFSSDAEITCAKPQSGPQMPWSKPAPAKYVLISQSIKNKDAKDIKSDNKMLDAGIAVGLRHLGLEDKDAVDAMIIFRCE